MYKDLRSANQMIPKSGSMYLIFEQMPTYGLGTMCNQPHEPQPENFCNKCRRKKISFLYSIAEHGLPINSA